MRLQVRGKEINRFADSRSIVEIKSYLVVGKGTNWKPRVSGAVIFLVPRLVLLRFSLGLENRIRRVIHPYAVFPGKSKRTM